MGALRERSPRSKAQTWPTGGAAPVAADGAVRAGLVASGVAWLRGAVRAEAGPGRLAPWLPVAFGAGIALYFAAAHEPVGWVAVATAMVLAGLAVLVRRRRAFALVALTAALAAGFALATMKAALVSHPVLDRPLYAGSLKGFVETKEVREKSDRFVLRVTGIEARGAVPKLTRVRLAVRKGTAPPVGSFIEVKARLTPPLAPLRPGGYDFARDLYFQGIGASGFVLGKITLHAPPQAGGVRLGYAAAMQGMRDAIDGRIRAVLDGDTRAIATALITGRRDAITPAVNDAMFVSGLGHILSISGYHMAVVAGVVFFVLRLMLALVPGLVTTFPIKKAAAAAALIAAGFYLLLSGAEVATQRSFLMTAVVLVAVMADRRAVTVRTLALAALAVLALAPEALVYPSFQMSFAATLALVVLVEFGMPRLFAAADSSLATRAALWGGREVAMLAAASLVAGLATMPYAAFHFHRLAPYGVVANLAAMPVVSGLVMPAGLAGLVAAPFGLDGPFWLAMGVGIEWMVLIAQWVAALPGAVGRVTAFGSGALMVMSAGILLLGLLRTRLRLTGLAVLAGGIVWAMAAPRPDIVVAADGASVAVRGTDGSLHMMRAGTDAFTVREWLAADADARVVSDPSLAKGVSCDDAGCVAALRGAALVALATRPEAFADDCVRAAVVVTRHQPPPACGALVIDSGRLAREGALALRAIDGGFAVDAARPRGSLRPWHTLWHARASSAATAHAAGRNRGVSATDATPPADAEPEGEVQ